MSPSGVATDLGLVGAAAKPVWPVGLGCVALATLLHVSVLALGPTGGSDAAVARVTQETIVELAPPPPPTPVEPAAPVETPKPTRKAPVAKAQEPAAARAGALMTATADAAGDDEPVAFVTDPNGQGYGSGIVAKGGTADIGTGRRVGPPVPKVGAPAAPAMARPAKLSGGGDVCRGFFPATATDDAATVAVQVSISANGRVTQTVVLSETPAGQGFGAATKSCLDAAKFEPAEDGEGTPMTSTLRFTVRFVR